MPSECRMPSIFGPTPEISLRSSRLPACRCRPDGSGRQATAWPAGGLGDRYGLRRLEGGMPARPCRGPLRCLEPARPRSRCWHWRPNAAAPNAGRLLGRRRDLDVDGDLIAGLVSGASVFGLAALDGGTVAAAGAGIGRCDDARRALPGGRAASLASLSRVDFSTAFSSRSVVRPGCGAEHDAVDLRADRHAVALAGGESVDDLAQPFRRQILIGVLEDHDHRRVDAGAEAFDLFPRQRALVVGVELVVMDFRAADIHQRFGAAQHAGRRAADLDMGAACRPASAGTACRRSRPRARGYRACRACRRHARSPPW